MTGERARRYSRQSCESAWTEKQCRGIEMCRGSITGEYVREYESSKILPAVEQLMPAPNANRIASSCGSDVTRPVPIDATAVISCPPIINGFRPNWSESRPAGILHCAKGARRRMGQVQ